MLIKALQSYILDSHMLLYLYKLHMLIIEKMVFITNSMQIL
jgi:hypothetical protein